MKTGFKGLAFTVMGALICTAFASCTALGPSDELGAGTSDVGTGSPDRVVSSPSVSNSAPAVGTTFTVSALVSNAGDEASVVTTMRFYRSTDATITTSDVEVGTDTVGALSPTGTSSPSATSSSQSGRLASTVDSGTNYYHGELETGRAVDSWNVLLRGMRGCGDRRVRHDQQLLVVDEGHGAVVCTTGAGRPGPESLHDRGRSRA